MDDNKYYSETEVERQRRELKEARDDLAAAKQHIEKLRDALGGNHPLGRMRSRIF